MMELNKSKTKIALTAKRTIITICKKKKKKIKYTRLKSESKFSVLFNPLSII